MMQLRDFTEYWNLRSSDEWRIYEQGHNEYAQTQADVVANFRRIADRIGVPMSTVCMVYLLKHIDGLCAYIKGTKEQRDSIQGRISDARIYLMLLAVIMLEEEETN